MPQRWASFLVGVVRSGPLLLPLGVLAALLVRTDFLPILDRFSLPIFSLISLRDTRRSTDWPRTTQRSLLCGPTLGYNA